MYKISLTIFQTPSTSFRVVEQTIYGRADSYWVMENGRYVFAMTVDGNSGTIRFADSGETFLVAVGVHNNKCWCDILPNLQVDQPGTVIHPQYYAKGTSYAVQRRKVLASYQVTSATGHQLTINYTQAEGQDLAADIIIA
ncbi:hypothetical protein C0989_002408 [Termitomyces sp. Mn162]|nr:hypothetical protein C0989_002408 [Termitomyces sp. Mn162]